MERARDAESLVGYSFATAVFHAPVTLSLPFNCACGETECLFSWNSVSSVSNRMARIPVGLTARPPKSLWLT